MARVPRFWSSRYWEDVHGLLYPRTFMVVEGILVLIGLAALVMAGYLASQGRW